MKQQTITNTNQTININNLNEYKGQILVRETNVYKWMFVLVGKSNNIRMLTTQGIDLHPEARFYTSHRKGLNNAANFFFNIFDETIPTRMSEGIIRLPTKNELQLYNKYTRKVRLLGNMSAK